MGLRKEYIKFLNDNVNLKKKKMLELGNQIVKDGCAGHHKTGKEFFSSFGCYHLSIDENGKDGAMIKDLSKAITDFDSEFDIVTNFGVSVYVDNWKMCYKNIFKMLKPGGVVVQVLPAKGSKWKANHFIDKKFINDLAKNFDCSVKQFKVLPGLHGNLVYSALVKNIKGASEEIVD